MALGLWAGKKRSTSRVSFQSAVFWGAVRTPDCRAASTEGVCSHPETLSFEAKLFILEDSVGTMAWAQGEAADLQIQASPENSVPRLHQQQGKGWDSRGL